MRLASILELPRASRVLLVALAALCGLCLLVSMAFAQTTVGTAPSIFDFGPLAALVLNFLAPTIGSAGGVMGLWVLYKLAAFLGLKIDDRRRAALEQVLERGIGLAVTRLEDRAIGGIPIELKDPAIRVAASYAEKAASGALKHFGKSSGDLQEMVESRLEGLLIDPSKEVVDPAPHLRTSIGAAA